ncbi:MAG: hypothetical protein IJ400_00640 [Clostridia bacterium]|nr:hypothetical protein [Clostridia bacterium]
MDNLEEWGDYGDFVVGILCFGVTTIGIFDLVGVTTFGELLNVGLVFGGVDFEGELGSGCGLAFLTTCEIFNFEN